MTDFLLKGGMPVYEQLEEHFARLIAEKVLPPDERIPTVRDTAKEFALNPNTVQKTYQSLERRGLIYSIPGKGSYVSSGEGEILREEAKKLFTETVEAVVRRGLRKSELLEIIERKCGE